MPVPTQAQLRAGVMVNIVLKVDQPTGKLTTGRVANILTRFNHPRGIKVRLSDGQIGRVQSLFQPDVQSFPSVEPGAPYVQKPFSFDGNPLATNLADSLTALSNSMRDEFKARMQEDYRNDPTPAETISLEQYIKTPTQKKKKKKPQEKAASSMPDTTTVHEAPGQVMLGPDIATTVHEAPGQVMSDPNIATSVEKGRSEEQSAYIDEKIRALGKDFPQFDTQVIAAIMGDHNGDVALATTTLKNYSI